MKEYSFGTFGICSRAIHFTLDGSTIHNVRFDGGCSGNLKAIAKLTEGKDAHEIIGILKGNDCGGKGTSCADQFARALEAALAQA